VGKTAHSTAYARITEIGLINFLHAVLQVDRADNVLNIVTQKLQSEGKYTAFGKDIAQEWHHLVIKLRSIENK
jgi:hypothetical protein